MYTETSIKPPPNQTVKYSPDQLIIKEGDYGSSVYRVAKGQVRVFKELQSGKAIVTELGEGEIFGDMAFINGEVAPHNSSAEAKGEVVLEIWHPLAILKDFDAAGPIVRILAAQLVNKLAKTDSIFQRLFAELKGNEENLPQTPRENLFKLWNSICKYRPLRGHTGRLLDGFVQQIGLNGIRLLVPEHVLLQVDHKPGSKIELYLNFPDEDPLMLHGEIAKGTRGDTPGYRAFEFEYTHLAEAARKRIESFICS